MVEIGDPRLNLTEFTAREASFAHLTWNNQTNGRRPNSPWDWTQIWSQWGYSRPKQFNMSLYYDTMLCGIALGRPSRQKTRMKLELVESHPDRAHPLKNRVFAITLRALENYALLIGAEEIRIMKPHRKLRDYYRSFHLTFVEGKEVGDYNGYLFRKIQ